MIRNRQVGIAMRSERDASLDAFKGLCLALVIFIHIQAGGGAWLGKWANPFKLVGFFVVSGHLLALKSMVSSNGFGEAVMKKWRGIMLPYFTFCLLTLAVLVPLRTNTLSGATAYSNVIISQMVLLRGYSTLWFLPVLFVAEMFFIGALLLESRLRGRFGYWSLAVHPLFALFATFLSIFLSPIAQSFIMVPPSQQLVGNVILTWLRALPAFVCIAVGYFAYGRLLALCRRHVGLLAGVGAVLVFVGFATGRLLGGIDWNNNVYGGNLCLFLFSGIVSSFGLMLVFNLVSRYTSMPLLRFIGVNSLVLMATHLPLPIIMLAKSVSAWICEQIPCFGAFLSGHFMVNCLWLFVIVIILEIPIVALFKYTPLKVLLGKKLHNSALVAKAEV